MKMKSKVIAAAICAIICVSGGAAVSAAVVSSAAKPEMVTLEAAEVKEEKKADVRSKTVYAFMSGDGAIEKTVVSDWNSDDTYDMSEREEALPVKLSVSYKLDGKSISPSELAGKSGKLVIRYDYENTEYKTATIDGESVKIYAPYAAMTGLVLDNEHCGNVEVKGGKVINDGDRTAVVGMAMPGLRDSLGLDSDTELPEYLEINMDVRDFELSNSMTIISKSLLNEIDSDSDKLSELDKLDSAADELNDGMAQLLDGSSQLSEGLNLLLEKAGELGAGVNTLSDGAAKIKGGTAELAAGAEGLQGGTAQLSAGLNQLSSNSAALDGGALQVFASLLSSADTQLAAAGLELPQLTPENYAAVLDGTLKKMEGIEAYKEAYMKISALKAQLDSYNSFYTGLLSYTAGVDSAAEGAAAASAGADKLLAGAKGIDGGMTELSGGISALKSAVPALTEGVTQLRDGSEELYQGLVTYNEQGISKITDLLQNKLGSLSERAEIIKEMAEEDGDVKYICRTDAIKTKE